MHDWSGLFGKDAVLLTCPNILQQSPPPVIEASSTAKTSAETTDAEVGVPLLVCTTSSIASQSRAPMLLATSSHSAGGLSGRNSAPALHQRMSPCRLNNGHLHLACRSHARTAQVAHPMQPALQTAQVGRSCWAQLVDALARLDSLLPFRAMSANATAECTMPPPPLADLDKGAVPADILCLRGGGSGEDANFGYCNCPWLFDMKPCSTLSPPDFDHFHVTWCRPCICPDGVPGRPWFRHGGRVLFMPSPA